jgi:hypothetical protein
MSGGINDSTAFLFAFAKKYIDTLQGNGNYIGTNSMINFKTIACNPVYQGRVYDELGYRTL